MKIEKANSSREIIIIIIGNKSKRTFGHLNTFIDSKMRGGKIKSKDERLDDGGGLGNVSLDHGSDECMHG